LSSTVRASRFRRDDPVGIALKPQNPPAIKIRSESEWNLLFNPFLYRSDISGCGPRYTEFHEICSVAQLAVRTLKRAGLSAERHRGSAAGPIHQRCESSHHIEYPLARDDKPSGARGARPLRKWPPSERSLSGTLQRFGSRARRGPLPFAWWLRRPWSPPENRISDFKALFGQRLAHSGRREGRPEQAWSAADARTSGRRNRRSFNPGNDSCQPGLNRLTEQHRYPSSAC
jgi:hypothetical protein